MTLENPMKICGISRGWFDPFHVRYLEMEEDRMPNEHSGPSRPIMHSKREPAGNGNPGEGAGGAKQQDGPRCYSAWVFRLIVSNATAGGMTGMDLNMESKSHGRAGKERDDRRQTSRAIIDFASQPPADLENSRTHGFVRLVF